MSVLKVDRYLLIQKVINIHLRVQVLQNISQKIILRQIHVFLQCKSWKKTILFKLQKNVYLFDLHCKCQIMAELSFLVELLLKYSSANSFN